MQIDQTLNDGLKRVITVKVPATQIEGKLDAQIADIAKKIRMPGFRPGKAPPQMVRKLHGDSVKAQILEEVVQESSQAVFAETQLRPAMQPQIVVRDYNAGGDLEFTMEFEVLPEFTVGSIDGIAIEKLSVAQDESVVEDTIRRFADQQKQFEAAEGRVAETGDAVMIDFVGKIDGEAFEGGTGKDVQLVLGSGQFIPGFEDQLVGVQAGDARAVTVSFPDDYQVAYLKGRPATFDVTVKEVRTATTVALDDTLAKNLGLESLDQLREFITTDLARQHESLTRTYMKRKLLDHLHTTHDFPVPDAMVEAEFAQIWQQLERETASSPDDRASMENEREEYRAIAVRRVRLGLLLSQIGQTNGVDVTPQEMAQLIWQEAQRYPAKQRQQVVEFFQQNAAASAQLRAPLYEEKVVDFILGKANITQRTVSLEALQAAIDSEDAASPPVEEAKPASKPRKKKAEAEDAAHDAPDAGTEAAPVKAAALEAASDVPDATAEEAAKPKRARAKKKDTGNDDA